MNNIELKNVTKKYPNFTLDKINMLVPQGAIVGLIGENGAGKTTLIKSILKIINIDDGTINLLGQNNNQVNTKDDIGVVLDNSFFPEVLMPKDINKIMANIFPKWDEELFKKYLTTFKIPLDKQIKNLSKGMRKKLEIATALAHKPKLLILDEPTSGLDPIVRNEILDIFLDFIQDEEKSILMSSHITSDLEHIADYIVFINEGQIGFTEDIETIHNQYGIAKCSNDDLKKIANQDIIRIKKNKYSNDILTNDRKHFSKKYPQITVDKASIEDIMLLYVKGAQM